MFGDNQQAQDNGTVPPMDPSVMADPAASPAPATDHQMTPAYPEEVASPSVQQMHQEAVMASAPAASVPAPDPVAPAPDPAAPSTGASDEELLGIKQEAMGALAPLVGSLEQSPEEKFKTTMMMIQASDDRSLVKTAYEAAQVITDEKMRAQALLDVINEINYFTSHQA